jgi:hypothetical protein
MTCGDPTTTYPLERTWNQDWTDFIYLPRESCIAQIAVGNRLELQGTAALVFGTQEQGTVGVYLGYNQAQIDHMFLLSPTGIAPSFPGGYQNLGIQFYAYPNQDCGGVPFYVSYKAAVVSHFYTTDIKERDTMVGAGYVSQGIAAYVLSPPSGKEHHVLSRLKLTLIGIGCGCDV